VAKAAALTTVGVLGLLAAWEAPWSSAGDPPVTSSVVTRTVTVTRTVRERYQGWSVRTWARHAVRNRRALNVMGRRLDELRHGLHERWAPTVAYAIRLASRVFGVDESKMRQVAYCESTFEPWAANGRYRGLFQLGWSPFGLSPFDPVANALSAAQTVARDGSWRQWTCG
jgi:hypothetical protein